MTLALLLTCGHLAAAPAALLISTSPDRSFEVVLVSDRTGGGQPAYHTMAIRDAKNKKELSLPEGADMDGAYNLRSLQARWSPDSSMVALSVYGTKGFPLDHTILRWHGGAWIWVSLPEGAIPEGWLPPNKLICTTRKQSVLKLNGDQTGFQKPPSNGKSGEPKAAR
jgi:hypothetical protein